MHACAACPLADTAQEFLSLADSSVKHRIFIHYTGWSNDRWDSWVDARCRWHTHTPPPTPHPLSFSSRLRSRVEHFSEEAAAAMKVHNAMHKLGKSNSKTAPADKAKKERKRRKLAAQLELDPNVEYNQLEASHAANILSFRQAACVLACFCMVLTAVPQRGAEAADDAGSAAHRGREVGAAASPQLRRRDSGSTRRPRAATGAY